MNQICARHSLHDIHIDKFDELDDMIAAALKVRMVVVFVISSTVHGSRKYGSVRSICSIIIEMNASKYLYSFSFLSCFFVLVHFSSRTFL